MFRFINDILEQFLPCFKRQHCLIEKVTHLHHLVYEIVDNSVDEVMQGHCDTSLVVLEGKGFV